MTAPYWLTPHDPDDFPDVALALRDPDGLLAVGGDLSVRRLLAAYRQGIFPWYSAGQPILWWSPDPRAVLFPDKLHVSRSLARVLRQGRFEVTFDQDFAAVIQRCSEPRADDQGTWITTEMQQAYIDLHAAGHAHSVEAWLNGELVGGVYGVSIGKVFFGESMFSRVSNASKVAFVTLVHQLRAWDFGLIDCQIQSEHLARFGAELIPRQRFVQLLDEYCTKPDVVGSWRERADAPATPVTAQK
jgi:leucyl/phenylalanyl-tRNA--protein transferase